MLAVRVTGFTEAEVAVPAMVAVPSPLSVKFTPAGSDPVICNAGVGFPVALTVKVPFTFTMNVVLLLLIICGGTFTVIVTVEVCLPPAAFVTVNVYVVVVVGETE